MGFLIVFDANDSKSYEEALNLHMLLLEDIKRRRIKLQPVVFLVANKIDADPQSEAFLQIMASAELYARERMVGFWQVQGGGGGGLQISMPKSRWWTLCDNAAPVVSLLRSCVLGSRPLGTDEQLARSTQLIFSWTRTRISKLVQF